MQKWHKNSQEWDMKWDVAAGIIMEYVFGSQDDNDEDDVGWVVLVLLALTMMMMASARYMQIVGVAADVDGFGWDG